MTPPSRRSRATGRITLADVAAQAGVSPITASRALRNARSVDPELAERVRAASARLGYVPDPAARALASARSSHVAVLVPLLTNAVFVDVLQAAQRTLRAAGYQALVGITGYDAAEEQQLLESFLLHRPAGMLMTGVDHNAATRALIASSGVPCVHMMELAGGGQHSVGFSQEQAGAAMTRHLLERGYRRIAFAAAQLDPRTLRRLEGWRAALREAGLHDPRLEWLNPQPSSRALGARLFEQILGQRPAVDAVFFCNDDLAQGALLCAARNGVKVPRRIAVAGFNDLEGSDQMPPPLTTIRTARSEIGAQAATMLLALMRREAVPQPALDVGWQLVVRDST